MYTKFIVINCVKSVLPVFAGAAAAHGINKVVPGAGTVATYSAFAAGYIGASIAVDSLYHRKKKA